MVWGRNNLNETFLYYTFISDLFLPWHNSTTFENVLHSPNACILPSALYILVKPIEPLFATMTATLTTNVPCVFSCHICPFVRILVYFLKHCYLKWRCLYFIFQRICEHPKAHGAALFHPKCLTWFTLSLLA